MNHKEALQAIVDRLQEGLLGPKQDTQFKGQETLLHEVPLNKYMTGILFPKGHKVRGSFGRALEMEGLGRKEGINNPEAESVEGEEEATNQTTTDLAEADSAETESLSEEQSLSTSAFWPDSMGISFCVPSNTTLLQVEIAGGAYRPAKTHERQVKIGENLFYDLFPPDGNLEKIFQHRIYFDPDCQALKIREEDGEEHSSIFRERHPLFAKLKEYKASLADLGKEPTSGLVDVLYTLLDTCYVRKGICLKKEIPIQKGMSNTFDLEQIRQGTEDSTSHAEIAICLKVYCKVYNNAREDKKYVRLQLINETARAPRGRDGDSAYELNTRCFFQSLMYIQLAGGQAFLPYQSARESLHRDDEAREIEFTYRNVRKYAVGHNGSAEWVEEDEVCKKVCTAWMPDTWTNTTTNSINGLSSNADEILKLEKLVPQANGGLESANLIIGLQSFANGYKNWIKAQEEEATQIQASREIGSKIIDRQKGAYKRLITGIELLESNIQALEAFRIANLAMFIQMILGRDERFGGREKLIGESIDVNLKSIDSFLPFNPTEKNPTTPTYRPFQLAFFLMALPGIVNEQDEEERNKVDLIWFPTGGGKTEAYLAITAFTIALRRMRKDPKESGGTTVLMRYTLRLLTAQQFERASRLICALEFLRHQEGFQTALGEDSITLGLYVGGSSTPNQISEAREIVVEIQKNQPLEKKLKANKFQIESCPWCGTGMIHKAQSGTNDIDRGGFIHEGMGNHQSFRIVCLNNNCFWHGGMLHNVNDLPIMVIDQQLYQEPPTLLFGTVDKFAQLAWQEQAGRLFGKQIGKLPPDLIIQDELHLLSGPLGSTVGLFETVIEELCRNEHGVGPKIITSTATTRNTDAQVKALYGKAKSVQIFPPTGLNYNDSYFSKVSNVNRRRYMGFIPTGKTSLDAQLSLLAHLMVGRIEVFCKAGDNYNLIDAYWTVLSYYNSLKDLGISVARAREELERKVKYLQTIVLGKAESERLSFNYRFRTDEELTSRIASHQVKSILKKIEAPFRSKNLSTTEGGRVLNDIIDLVFATNMVSVGVDVGRLNMMLFAGMPRTVAEYIQASSRVAREREGLVLVLVSPSRARERSHFEHFVGFHQAFYQYVEPLSATPATSTTIERMLPTLLGSYVRNCVDEMSSEKDAFKFDKAHASELDKLIKARFDIDDETAAGLSSYMDELSDKWKSKSMDGKLNYSKSPLGAPKLFQKPSETQGKVYDEGDPTWMVLNSMREVGEEAWVSLANKSDKPNKR